MLIIQEAKGYSIFYSNFSTKNQIEEFYRHLSVLNVFIQSFML